jgi:uncharacterized protein YjiS (DUF1127 family)
VAAINPSESGPKGPSLIGRLREVTLIAVAWIRADIRRRRGHAQLARLDDHLLRDIGLTRNDVARTKKRAAES